MAELDQRDIPSFDREVANFRDDVNPRQRLALALLDCGLIKFLLYGGALGGGKSYFLRWYGVRRLIKLFLRYGIYGLPAMLACEDYPSLKDRQLVKITREMPRWLGKRVLDHKDYGNCFILNEEYGAGVLCFRNLDDPSKYASSEWVLILVDELTKNIYDTFTNLRMRLRWPGIPDEECQFVGGTNPGSIGHGWVRALWMDKIFGREWIEPIDYRQTFAYVPSKADDNPYLDQAYWNVLNTLPRALRKAFRDGDWSTFIGQAFIELSRVTHQYQASGKNLFPEGAWLMQTLDWGFGKPFSVGWWHTDSDGRLYRAAEWYGWDGTPNVGLRLADGDIAAGIIEREKQMGIWGKTILRKAGPDSFNRKPNYKGGGQGKSTAEVFREAGLVLTPGDPSRELKIRQFHERLRAEDVDHKPIVPMMLINASCEQFWRTVPDLIVDKNNIEDVDTNGEDHIYDEAALACMARPLKTLREETEKRLPPKDVHEVARLEQQQIWAEVRAMAGHEYDEPF